VIGFITFYITWPVLFSVVLLRNIQELQVPANCNDECVLHLVLIQQRRNSGDARSNSRADWPELRNFRLKVKIFQRGAKFAPSETRHRKRAIENASPKMLHQSQRRVSVRWLCSWDLVTRKYLVAFGVNVALDSDFSSFPIGRSPETKRDCLKHKLAIGLQFFSCISSKSRKSRENNGGSQCRCVKLARNLFRTLNVGI